MSYAHLAIINPDKCRPDKCNFECKRICPVNRTGKECVTIGYTNDDKPKKEHL